MRKIAVYKIFEWRSCWIISWKRFVTSWGNVCWQDLILCLLSLLHLCFCILRHLEYILMLEFGSVIQPWTTIDEPCLTLVVNSNWQLILQLISRASKLLVTEGLQHEPDLTKRSFYWILSGGAYWENRVPCMPYWLMVIWIWEHGLVETKCKLCLVVIFGSLRINWEF